MAINYSQAVYLPAYDMFARPVIFYPVVSRPLIASYQLRGIYNTVPIDIAAADGSIFSDMSTILDILEEEFTVLPVQRDRLFIPENAGMPEVGTFEIIDTDPNGGGETTLTLRRVVMERPA